MVNVAAAFSGMAVAAKTKNLEVAQAATDFFQNLCREERY